MGKSLTSDIFYDLSSVVKTNHLPGVDLIKYIMSFGVVAIHFRVNYNPDWNYPFIFDWLIKLGVPFFFLTSGYLLQRKLETCVSTESSKIARLKAFKYFRIWLC